MSDHPEIGVLRGQLFAPGWSWKKHALTAMTQDPLLVENMRKLVMLGQRQMAELFEQKLPVDSKSIASLAMATKLVVEAGKRALLIDDWNIVSAESYLRHHHDEEAPEIETVDPSQPWLLQLMGDQVPADKVKELISGFFDVPRRADVGSDDEVCAVATGDAS